MMQLGLLAPHFGAGSSYERVFAVGERLEKLGFSSLFFRDQLGFTGGVSFENPSYHFVDPFIAMSAIAATTHLTVGTATLTPIRRPVVLAQMVGSLAYLAAGRVVLGVGLGGQPRAFRLAGLSIENREALFEEMVEVLRVTSRAHATYRGPSIAFEDLTLDPAPPADLTLLYCGSSLGAIKRAVRWTDGWLPGRCPFSVFDRLHSRLKEEAEAAGKPMRVAIVPLLSMAEHREKALAKVNVQGILDESRRKPAWTRDGPFESDRDLAGALIAGSAEDVIEDLKEFEARGVDEVVLDLRERMDAFEESIEALGELVLPHFRA
jgi:alkanesulfonate monooxygenase SsuD/methylene tetrahydromethanopterin reductase-like flavin-dependent oxidoreductase (luciferase family)